MTTQRSAGSIPAKPPKSVLVTGGAGFIGSHLTECLLARGDRVTVVDDESTGSRDNLRGVWDHPHFEFVAGSVTDAELVNRSVAQVDEVYHLAAAVGVALIAEAPIETIRRNVDPVQHLLAALLCQHRQRGIPMKLFLASTSEVYGKNPRPQWSENDDLVFGPTTCSRWSYGASKAIDEFLALAYWREYRLPIVIGRLFNVVGPRQTGRYGMVLPRFIEAARRGEPLIVHDDGQQERCFAHVADVVGAIVSLMGTPSAVGQVFNIGSDTPISIGELARQVVSVAGTGSPIEFQTYCQAYSADFEDVRRRVPDLSRLRQTIDYRPEWDLQAIIQELV